MIRGKKLSKRKVIFIRYIYDDTEMANQNWQCLVFEILWG